MRRTSFVGALFAIAVGGALAYGVQWSPKQLDIHLAGLIIMIAGIADLLVRFLISDSPLFSPTTADVAAVVEPLGEPVLDVFGNPITPAQPPARPPLIAPAPTIVQPIVQPPTQMLPVVVEELAPAAPAVVDAPTAQQQPVTGEPRADQVVRHVGDHHTDESLVPVSALTGRPVRVRRRRRNR
jgi:hypothetical protein